MDIKALFSGREPAWLERVSRRARRSGWSGRPGRRAGGRREAEGLHPAVRWGLALGAGYAAWKTWQWMREADLTGQVVLITGGSRGLGLLLAHEFARQGCRIAICARDLHELARAEDEIAGIATDVMALRCDVADAVQTRQMVETVTERYGRIDILVNNAGIMQVGPLATVTEKDFAEALDVMFWGTLHPTMAVLPQMRRRGAGRIVNVTSIGGMVSVPHMLPYTCAKFAAVGLSQGLHAELSREGIQVTTIVPGLMRVGSHVNVRFRGDQEREYAWFSTGASLMSISAERAARMIVRATRRGEALRILGLSANVLERVHGLFPAATSNVMALINRALPNMLDGGSYDSQTGSEVRQKLRSRLVRALTSPANRAARRTNQLPPHKANGG